MSIVVSHLAGWFEVGLRKLKKSSMFLFLFFYGGPLMAHAAAQSVIPRGNPWPKITERDLDETVKVLETRYIYGVYGGDPSNPTAKFDATMEAALGIARTEAATASSAIDSQYVLKKFIAAFDDTHLNIFFNTMPVNVRWPGFLIYYTGHDFHVGASTRPGVPDGALFGGCDGHAADVLIQRFSGPTVGESMKARFAPHALEYPDNHYEVLPKSCLIGGQPVTLIWSKINAASLAGIEVNFQPLRDTTLSVTDFGDGGTWVRIPTFSPEGGQANAFKKLISDAPSLRDRSMIVIDLRGNGGGPYEWFMGLLRGLYGTEFTDYYARARLQIQNVRLDIKPSAKESQPMPAAADEQPPADPSIASWEVNPTRESARHGQHVFVDSFAPLMSREKPVGPPPQNPVHALVFVLTDNGSASAVNSFLDEVKAIPGVYQVGSDPTPDRLSGSPMHYVLSDRDTTLSVAYMTRNFRARGNLQENVPAYLYDGDMRDTAALKVWITGLAEQIRAKASNTVATP